MQSQLLYNNKRLYTYNLFKNFSKKITALSFSVIQF